MRAIDTAMTSGENVLINPDQICSISQTYSHKSDKGVVEVCLVKMSNGSEYVIPGTQSDLFKKFCK